MSPATGRAVPGQVVHRRGLLDPIPVGDHSPMIDALKSDEIVNKLGGRFKLTALIQRRLGELIDGARPLVDRNGRSDLEVVIDEILHEKITIDFPASGIPAPGENPGVSRRR